MRKEFVIAVLFLLGIFLLSVVSAEVWFIAQPEGVYSIGDYLEIAASVSPLGDQLETEIVCENKTKLIFLKYLDNETIVNILQPLTRNFLGSLEGNCVVVLNYGANSVKSTNFLISDIIFMKTEIDKLDYEPGEEIVIKGKAEKANSQLLEGFFEIVFEETNLTLSGPVEGGTFKSNITLPLDIAADFYLLNLTVYEKAGEEITNIGKARLSVRVKQLPSKLEVALDNQDVKPGNNLSFRILLYDQSEEIITGESSFLIEDIEGQSFTKNLIKIDETENFFIEKNFSSGYYKIKAYSSGIYGEREFYVEENEEAEFKIINGTLTIKNIGNINYNRAIQVKINDIVEIINTELLPSEEKRYEIKAPDGSYSIIITDGENTESNEAVTLTGSAVNIKEVGRSFFARNKFLAWVFLILVMGLFIFTGARRTLRKRYTLSKRSGEPGKLMKGKGIVKVGKKEGKPVIMKEPREAEHSLVLKGQKQNVALICLKVKNELTETSKSILEGFLKEAQDTQKGRSVIYKSGDFFLIMFSPLITKTFKNHVPAVKIAIDIQKRLRNYNSLAKDKIDFGLAVHSGDIVNSLQENKLKFTSLGNTLHLAKKIADLSRQEVLLTKELHEKTVSSIKTDKVEKKGIELFKIKRILDTQRNSVFIQDFLKKMAEEAKKK